MARAILVREIVEIPGNVTVDIRGKKVKVKGPLGEIEKDFSHVHNILISKEDNTIIVETYLADKRTRAVVRTVASKIKNMIDGVLKGYRYKMRVIYAHFPMEVKVDEKKGIVTIKNFLGRRDAITARIMPGAKVRVQGKKDIIVEGIDLDAVAQTAANIHLAAKLRGKERLSPHGREGGPGVLDGIYVYEKTSMK